LAALFSAAHDAARKRQHADQDVEGFQLEHADNVAGQAFRVSARAKALWKKVQANLPAIIRMGVGERHERYEVTGALRPGEIYGHTEVDRRAYYPCTLVAMEECVYYTLSAAAVLTLSRDYPAIALQVRPYPGPYLGPYLGPI